MHISFLPDPYPYYVYFVTRREVRDRPICTHASLNTLLSDSETPTAVCSATHTPLHASHLKPRVSEPRTGTFCIAHRILNAERRRRLEISLHRVPAGRSNRAGDLTLILPRSRMLPITLGKANLSHIGAQGPSVLPFVRHARVPRSCHSSTVNNRIAASASRPDVSTLHTHSLSALDD